jgi:phenylacetate-CoA ligase
MIPGPLEPTSLSAYQQFCHRVLLPASDALLGHDVAARFRQLRRFQWLSREEIEQHRSARLQALVLQASTRVPFYRDYFSRSGLDPLAIRAAGDLALLPIVGKMELREQPERLMVEGYRGRTTAMKSSGSTGAQTTVYLDNACQTEVFATQLLYLSWGGFAMGKPHLQTGMSLQRGAVRTLKDRLFRCTYVSGFELTDQRVEKALQEIDRRGIRMVMGYASSLYVIARYLQKSGRRVQMDSAFTWGDSLFPHYRELIEATIGCRVTDCYGLGEGLQCAAQCEEYDALHEHMHGVIVEIVDGDGRPVEDGELGRVVVTRLEAGPMPLIRYDTGDAASFVAGPCGCGRELRRLSRVQGRATDIVTTPGGDRLIVHVFTQIFEMLPEIRQFQVRQTEPESIRILYVPAQHFTPAVLEQVRGEIGRHCVRPPRVDFEPVEDIPLEASNKRRFVISSVPF